jgi:uncharacterized protein
MVEGSLRGLFSMLFGVSMFLIISRLEKTSSGLTPADIYYRRLLWLLMFGVINAFVLNWPGDILYTYAVCGMFVFPLRNSSPKLLISLAVMIILISMFKDWLSTQERLEIREKGLISLALEEKKDSLTTEQKADLEKWKGYLESQKIENKHKKAEEEVKAMRQSYAGVWEHLAAISVKMETTLFYNILFFDALIFILFGLAFYKLGFITGEKNLWVYAVLIVAGYGIGIYWGYLMGHAWRVANHSFYDFAEPGNVILNLLYQPHRLFVTLGHLGVIMLVWKSNLFGWLLTLLARVGQMAFTNYLMQSVICTLIFYGYGLGYYGMLERWELWYVVVGVWIFQLVFSTLWLRFFVMGPLEWVWRNLTYWKIHPLVKRD